MNCAPTDDRQSLITLIDQINDNLDDGLLLFGAAFGDEQGERHQGVVGKTFGAIGAVEDLIVRHKIDEQRGGDAFVAVGKGVVFNVSTLPYT